MALQGDLQGQRHRAELWCATRLRGPPEQDVLRGVRIRRIIAKVLSSEKPPERGLLPVRYVIENIDMDTTNLALVNKEMGSSPILLGSSGQTTACERRQASLSGRRPSSKRRTRSSS